MNKAKRSTKVAKRDDGKSVLLSGGNPQIAKADGRRPGAGLHRGHARMEK